MRDKARMVKLITYISKIWRMYPDLRLGQMIENVKPRNLDDLYYLEDSDLIELLKLNYPQCFYNQSNLDIHLDNVYTDKNGAILRVIGFTKNKIPTLPDSYDLENEDKLYGIVFASLCIIDDSVAYLPQDLRVVSSDCLNDYTLLFDFSTFDRKKIEDMENKLYKMLKEKEKQDNELLNKILRSNENES